MDKPLISICIPVYNGATFLKECLDSAVAQTFRNFEVVICDDGSMDASLAIAETYRQKHSFIRVYKNEFNLGLVGNWNRCIELAAGTWIKLLFQDDVLFPNCLQSFAQHAEAGYPLLVCRRNFMLNEQASPDDVDYYTNRVRTLENTGHYHSDNFAAITISKIAAANISLNFIAEPPLTLFKKQLVDEIGPFDSDLKQICDLEFFLRAASRFGIRYIPQQLCGFRIHTQSTTQKNISGKNYRLQYLEALTFALKLMSKPQFADFRKALSYGERFKLRLYIKYKSYIAFRAIGSKEEETQYNTLKQNYNVLWFNNYERFYLKLLTLLKS